MDTILRIEVGVIESTKLVLNHQSQQLVVSTMANSAPKNGEPPPPTAVGAGGGEWQEVNRRKKSKSPSKTAKKGSIPSFFQPPSASADNNSVDNDDVTMVDTPSANTSPTPKSVVNPPNSNNGAKSSPVTTGDVSKTLHSVKWLYPTSDDDFDAKEAIDMNDVDNLPPHLLYKSIKLKLTIPDAYGVAGSFTNIQVKDNLDDIRVDKHLRTHPAIPAISQFLETVRNKYRTDVTVHSPMTYEELTPHTLQNCRSSDDWAKIMMGTFNPTKSRMFNCQMTLLLRVHSEKCRIKNIRHTLHESLYKDKMFVEFTKGGVRGQSAEIAAWVHNMYPKTSELEDMEGRLNNEMIRFLKEHPDEATNTLSKHVRNWDGTLRAPEIIVIITKPSMTVGRRQIETEAFCIMTHGKYRNFLQAVLCSANFQYYTGGNLIYTTFKTSNAKKYKGCIQSQNEFLTNTTSVAIIGVTHKQMQSIDKPIKTISGVVNYYPTSKAESHGRWIIAIKKERELEASLAIDKLLAALTPDDDRMFPETPRRPSAHIHQVVSITEFENMSKIGSIGNKNRTPPSSRPPKSVWTNPPTPKTGQDASVASMNSQTITTTTEALLSQVETMMDKKISEALTQQPSSRSQQIDQPLTKSTPNTGIDMQQQDATIKSQLENITNIVTSIDKRVTVIDKRVTVIDKRVTVIEREKSDKAFVQDAFSKYEECVRALSEKYIAETKHIVEELDRYRERDKENHASPSKKPIPSQGKKKRISPCTPTKMRWSDLNEIDDEDDQIMTEESSDNQPENQSLGSTLQQQQQL